MLSFLKHKFTHKEMFFARWGATHLVIALLAGILLAVWLIGWHLHGESGGAQVMKAQASETMESGSPVPPNTKIGGPFTLTSQDGKPVSDKDFAGKYLLVYFGYTNCPDMCPTGLQSISRAMDDLKDRASKVQPLFITVDPVRDTPQRLKEYDSAFSPAIIGLTGAPEQIAAVAKEYQAYYQKGEGDQDYEVEHSSLIYLVDPSGNLLTTFEEEVDPKLIVAALDKAWAANP